MLQDRRSFVDRLDALRSACDELLLVNSADPLHSERAKQLRRGVCIMAFSALEEFIRLRAATLVKSLLPVAIPFAYLPDRLRTAATLGALEGILFQQKFVPQSSKFAFLTEEFKALGSLADQNYSISRFAFAHSNPNVQHDEIEAMLTAFHVEKPWETVYNTARRLKIATPNPSRAEFRTLSENRHAAAHTQVFDIPNVDLKAQINSALSIGVALDVVLSAAIRNLNTCLATHGALTELRANAIVIYFISTVPIRGKYRLEMEGKKVARHTDPTLQPVKNQGLQKLLSGPGVLVLHDGTYVPKEWYCEQ